MKKKSFKVILDTDPGVDDSNALVYAINDPQFDIKLITISNGNIDIDNAARNMCHILDLFHKDLPVVKGYRKRLGGSKEDASFLHTKEGLGGYRPPKTTEHKLIEKDAADAMYEVLQKYPKQITLVILGPHTNFAYLIQKHPDAKDLIKNILMMGGAPKGIKANPNHNSFNIRTDAPAFKYTVDSGIPTIMVPSSIGRDEGHFTEEMVEELSKTNDVGKFLATTFQTYWEPNYPDRRIATNDLSAIYYLTYPKLYKVKTADIRVDESNGKTIADFKHNGNFKVVVGLNRKKFMKIIFDKLKEMNDIKLQFADQKTPKTQKNDAKTIKKHAKTAKNSKTTTKTTKATTAPKTAKTAKTETTVSTKKASPSTVKKTTNSTSKASSSKSQNSKSTAKKTVAASTKSTKKSSK